MSDAKRYRMVGDEARRRIEREDIMRESRRRTGRTYEYASIGQIPDARARLQRWEQLESQPGSPTSYADLAADAIYQSRASRKSSTGGPTIDKLTTDREIMDAIENACRGFRGEAILHGMIPDSGRRAEFERRVYLREVGTYIKL